MFKHLIGIDFESYYDKEYSLAKMPTHQYIRDGRFRCLGCGFQIDNEAPFYDMDGAVPTLARLDRLGWDSIALVAHRASFDGSVLYERFRGRKPAFWFDTQLIARWAIAQGHLPPEQGVSLAKLAPLVGMTKGNTWDAVHGGGQQLDDYGTEDIKIMMALLRLFLRWRPPAEELEYMDMHVRMMTEPRFVLDVPKLAEAATITPRDVELNKLLRKDANMVNLLTKHGVEVEYKTTPKGKTKPALAKTDAFMQGLLQHEDPRVAELASLRLGANSSITRTRAQTMIRVGEPLPFPVLYHGAHTGRASGTDGYNMQNNPAGGVIRQSIKPPAGHVFVVGDSRQIEARTVGWRAGDARLLETFRSEDPYRTFGGRYVYRCPPEDLDDTQRKISKAGLLGLGFGQGWRGLVAGTRRQSGLVIPDDMAQSAVRAYRTGFDRVPVWWRRLMRWAREDGYIELPDGRKILYPDLREEEFGEGDEARREVVFDRPTIFSKGPRGKRQTVKLWHGLACENDTQAVARSVVFWQAMMMRRDGIPVVGMAHDEVISVSPRGQASEVAQLMDYWLRQVPPWAEGLPVEGEVKIGNSYAECK